VRPILKGEAMKKILCSVFLMCGICSVPGIASERPVLDNTNPVFTPPASADTRTEVVVSGTASGGTITMTYVRKPVVSVTVATNAGDTNAAIASRIVQAATGKIGRGIAAYQSTVKMANVSIGMIAIKSTDAGLNFAKAVTNLTASADTTGVKLQWQKPDGVKRVRIWRDEKEAATTEDVSYIDKQAIASGESVTYTVVSFDDSDNPGDSVTVKYTGN
jgi:hypothetical protein